MAPRSADCPRLEHMANAAVSVGWGVMIRVGSGAGSLVSDDDSIRKPEHMSASKKAPPPAQNRKRPIATDQPGTTNHGNATTYLSVWRKMPELENNTMMGASSAVGPFSAVSTS